MLRSPPALIGALLLMGCGSSSGSSTDAGAADHEERGHDGRSPIDAGADRTAKDAAIDHALNDATSDAPRDAPADAPVDSAPPDAVTDGPAAFYTTKFPLTENPISESGKWINGGTTGIDWGNVQTTPGHAFGTVVSLGPPYNDSTAVLAAPWPANQTAKATVHTVNQTSGVYEEVELRLRTTITAHSITGYEFNFRCIADGSQYAQIVRWNGALNDFTYVDSRTGPGLHDGDVVMATAVGSTLTTYINGTAIFSATDSTFATGHPGIGFYNQGGTLGQNADYGFEDFTATGE
jgi:hypothetical protein